MKYLKHINEFNEKGNNLVGWLSIKFGKRIGDFLGSGTYKNNKHLKKFFEYNSDIEDRQNYILDKINKVGVDNITSDEKHFLDSMKDKESAIKALDDYNSQFYDETFKSDDDLFTFNLSSITSEDSESDDGIITSYHGTMILSNDIITEEYDGVYQLNVMDIYMADFYNGDKNIKDSEIFIERKYDNFLYELSHEVRNINIK